MTYQLHQIHALAATTTYQCEGAMCNARCNRKHLLYCFTTLICCVCFVNRLAAADHLWDMLALNGHGLRSVIFTSTGDKMILSSQDSIQIRDPETGAQVAKSLDVWAVGHPCTLLLPGDSEIVVFDYRSRALVRCNILNGTMVQITSTDSSIISLQCFSDDMKYVVTVQNAPYNWYKRWDLATGKEVDSWKSALSDTAFSKINFEIHTASMAFMNGSYLCSQDTAYRWWGEWQHVFTGTAHFSASTHERLDSITSYRLLAVSPDGSKLCYSAEWVEAGSPARMIIWSREDGSYKSIPNIVAARHSTFRFSDDSKYVLAWTHSRDSLLVIDSQNPEVLAAYGATFAFGSMSRRGIVAVNSLYYLEVFKLDVSSVKDENSSYKVENAWFDGTTNTAVLPWIGTNGVSRITVSDLHGRSLIEQSTFRPVNHDSELSIDLAALPIGLYLITAYDTKMKARTYKLLKSS